MLNIDYSTKRKFVLSLGITMIFLGVLLYFSTNLFMAERIDKSIEQVYRDINNTEYIETINKIFDAQLEIAIFARDFSVGLIFFGIIFASAGIALWIKKED